MLDATYTLESHEKMTDFETVCMSHLLSNVNVNVNVVYSGHALSFEIASLGMPLKYRKQITLNEHNMVKNPNWLEADQLAIYKA